MGLDFRHGGARVLTMANDDVNPSTLQRAFEAAQARITELEAERDRWRSLLVDVVGVEVAERMWEGLSQ